MTMVTQDNIAKVYLIRRVIVGKNTKKNHWIRLDNLFTLCGINTSFEKVRYHKENYCKICNRVADTYSHFIKEL